jgi:Putative lumazine-binding
MQHRRIIVRAVPARSSRASPITVHRSGPSSCRNCRLAMPAITQYFALRRGWAQWRMLRPTCDKTVNTRSEAANVSNYPSPRRVRSARFDNSHRCRDFVSGWHYRFRPDGGTRSSRPGVARLPAVTDAREKAAVARSFHPAALLNSVASAGGVRGMTQEEWWERVSSIPSDTPPRTSSIKLVEVVGVAAIARIDIIDAKGRTSTDLFTLLKTADGWRIINKVLSTPL